MNHTSPRVQPYGAAAPESLAVELARSIDESDLALLGALEAPPITANEPIGQGVKRLRDSHHALARLLAGGVSNLEASSITGYSPGYITTLKGDPSFKELIEFYRSNLDLAQADVTFRLTALNLSFIGELQDRLEANPAGMSNSFVLEAVKVLSDRTGHAPMVKSLNVNVDLAGRLESARRRAAEASGPLLTLQAGPGSGPEVAEIDRSAAGTAAGRAAPGTRPLALEGDENG